MRILIKVWLLFSLLFSQIPNFNLDGCDDCKKDTDQILSLSGLWLSHSPIFNPRNNSKILIEYDVSTLVKNKKFNNWYYPNFNISAKITKNLSITSKLFGFSSEGDLPQIIGAGFQYYFGENDTLSSVFSIQRTDLKGIKDFTYSSISLGIKKWYEYKLYKLRYGLGSVFYKSKINIELKKVNQSIKKQINFFEIEGLYPFSVINSGIGLKFNNRLIMFKLVFQKELF